MFSIGISGRRCFVSTSAVGGVLSRSVGGQWSAVSVKGPSRGHQRVVRRRSAVGAQRQRQRKETKEGQPLAKGAPGQVMRD